MKLVWAVYWKDGENLSSFLHEEAKEAVIRSYILSMKNTFVFRNVKHQNRMRYLREPDGTKTGEAAVVGRAGTGFHTGVYSAEA